MVVIIRSFIRTVTKTVQLYYKEVIVDCDVQKLKTVIEIKIE